MAIVFPAAGGTRSPPPPQEDGSCVSLSLKTAPLCTFLLLSLTLYFRAGVPLCGAAQHLLLAGQKCS